MPLPPWAERLPDGTLADALKRVPATPPEPIPAEPTLIESIVADFQDGTGHDLDLDVG